MTPRNNASLSTALLAAALVISLPATSYGFAEFARGGITLETDARVTYDSFIIGAPKYGDDDYYARLHPELKYERKAGLANISAFAGLSVIRYQTYDQWDSEDFSAGLSTELPVAEGSRISGDFNINYTEATVIDYNVLDRIRQKTFRADANFHYQLGLKTSLRDSVDYTDVQRGSQYSNQRTLGNNLSFAYSDFLDGTSFRLTHGFVRTTSSGDNFLGHGLDQTSNSVSAGLSRPVIGPLVGDASYGYRWLDRSNQENLIGQGKINGSFFSVSVRGPFLPPRMFPKMDSNISVTYSNSRSPGINDLGNKTLTGAMSVGWQARERTHLSLSAERTVNLSANDLSVQTTRATFGINQSVSYNISLHGDVSYVQRKFTNLERTDGTWEAAASGNYTLNKYWNAGVAYTYQNNTTDGDTISGINVWRMRAYDYERHTVSIYVKNVF
ncbi:MAG TPA: outer membrane beta-barrel protein [Opitutaceae bacterium]|nr:outer membrane beta-barrel protein [Opitutaceae bacterium]